MNDLLCATYKSNVFQIITKSFRSSLQFQYIPVALYFYFFFQDKAEELKWQSPRITQLITKVSLLKDQFFFVLAVTNDDIGLCLIIFFTCQNPVLLLLGFGQVG